MKKIVSTLIVLLAVSFALSAGDVAGLKFSAEGSVSAAWGVDLDTADSGFKIAGCDLKIKLTSNGETFTKGGEGTYGEVGIKDVKIEVENTGGDKDVVLKVGDMYGKIVIADMLTIMLKNGGKKYGTVVDGDMLGNIANAYDIPVWTNDKGYGDKDVANDDDGKFKANPTGASLGANYGNKDDKSSGVGVKLSIKDVLDVAVDFASANDWTDGLDDERYSVAFGVALTAVKDLTLAAGFSYDTFGADKDGVILPNNTSISLGAKAAYKIAITEGVVITPSVGVVFDNTNKEAIDTNDKFLGALSGGLRAEVLKAVATANLAVGLAESKALNMTAALDLGKMIDSNLTIQAGLEYIGIYEYAAGTDAKAAAGAVYGWANVAPTGTATVWTYDPSINVAPTWQIMTAATAASAAVAAKNKDTYAWHGKLAYGIKFDDKVTLTPSVAASINNKNGNAPGSNGEYGIFMKAGLELTGAVANTTFAVNWDSNDLYKVEVADKPMGQIVVSAKVSF